MGKGNFILGTGSSSIGDVTFARRNGQQIARVRVRKIKNPKSYGQAEQRMYMSPVTKFYSPLAKVLETSFEGLSKADSYAKFISVNANLARANGWAVNKGSNIIPLPYQLSNGTLGRVDPEKQGLLISTSAFTGTTIGDLSTTLKSKYPSLENGDQVTIIVFAHNNADQSGVFTNITLSYARFFINTQSTDTIADSEVKVVNNTDYYLIPKSVSGLQSVFAAGIIVSRFENNAWRRSPAFMVCDSSFVALHTGADNLTAAIASYMKSAGVTPISDVYLNGSDD